jgi:anti-anti-sigma regulatory factor
VAETDDARAGSASAPEPTYGPETVVVVLAGTLDDDMVPALVDRMCRLLDNVVATRIVCDATAVTAPDAVAVEALARLQLAARRRGLQVWLRDGEGGVLELLALAGLNEVVRQWPGPAERPAGTVEPDGRG